MDGAHYPIHNDLIPASSCNYERKYYDTSLHMQSHLVPRTFFKPY
jgi:hypothetical protein